MPARFTIPVGMGACSIRLRAPAHALTRALAANVFSMRARTLSSDSPSASASSSHSACSERLSICSSIEGMRPNVPESVRCFA